jgi:hypothetical protein
MCLGDDGFGGSGPQISGGKMIGIGYGCTAENMLRVVGVGEALLLKWTVAWRPRR